MANNGDEEVPWEEKVQALLHVARYRPRFTASLIVLGAGVALFEGIGLGFIWPIIEVARADQPITEAEGVLAVFLETYRFLGIPFTIELLILGVAAVMTVRFTSSFLVAWLRVLLQKQYERELRRKTFERALDARVRYFDREGSDDILNAIITETRYSGEVITQAVKVMQAAFLVGMYFAVMVYISVQMALFAVVLLGGITVVLRYILEPAYTVGSRVAEANERIQQAVQAGTQGIRDVKLFGLTGEIYHDFKRWLDEYVDSSVYLNRNEAALQNFYELAAALSLFALIYIGFVFSGLNLGQLAIFFFAMFRLSPLASRVNKHVYRLEGRLSHLVRTLAFNEKIQGFEESSGSRSVPRIDRIEFEDIWFAYGEEEQVIRGVSFGVERGDFVGFVGQSGAGKSTIVSLLARLYEPDEGAIRANGVPIEEYDLREWRSRVAVVRQQPFIFNATLWDNVTVGNREASRREVEQVCEIARVDEFFDDLPNGFDTQLGEDGVRLSGGQRQRVAIARALLKDADFLLLDEATSDLDSHLEQQVQAAIEAMDRDYAIIAIAHRLSTVQNADRIYTMDDGKIVESGTHEELLDDEGQYAELYAIQSAQ